MCIIFASGWRDPSPCDCAVYLPFPHLYIFSGEKWKAYKWWIKNGRCNCLLHSLTGVGDSVQLSKHWSFPLCHLSDSFPELTQKHRLKIWILMDFYDCYRGMHVALLFYMCCEIWWYVYWDSIQKLWRF